MLKYNGDGVKRIAYLARGMEFNFIIFGFLFLHLYYNKIFKN